MEATGVKVNVAVAKGSIIKAASLDPDTTEQLVRLAMDPDLNISLKTTLEPSPIFDPSMLK